MAFSLESAYPYNILLWNEANAFFHTAQKGQSFASNKMLQIRNFIPGQVHGYGNSTFSSLDESPKLRR